MKSHANVNLNGTMDQLLESLLPAIPPFRFIRVLNAAAGSSIGETYHMAIQAQLALTYQIGDSANPRPTEHFRVRHPVCLGYPR